MGGVVFEFPVVPSPQILTRAGQPRRTLLVRLLGAEPEDPESHLLSNTALRPIQKRLLEAFCRWLGRAIARPWAATEGVRTSYLALVRPEDVALSGCGPGARDEGWAVRFRLSGCAGMAECSARLVSHWLEHWFQRERERIACELLGPAGIELGRDEPRGMVTDETFLPIGSHGYAMFHPDLAAADRRGEAEPLAAEFSPFELDGRLGENDPVMAGALRRALRTRFTELMRDGKCRCQLCMPQFDPAVVADLPA